MIEKGIIVLRADGSREEKECIKPSLSEMQALVGGYCRPVRCRWEGKMRTMIINEEGTFLELPVNQTASEAYGGLIVGDAAVLIGYQA